MFDLSRLPSFSELRGQHADATFDEFAEFREEATAILETWNKITQEEFESTTSDVRTSGIKRSQSQSQMHSPPTVPVASSTSPVFNSQTPSHKRTKLARTLADSPPHAIGGANPFHILAIKRQSESHRDRMQHTSTICSEFLLATKHYIEFNCKLLPVSADLNKLPQYMKDIPNFREAPNYCYFLYTIIRDSSAHVGQGHVFWGSDFVFFLRAAQTSICLHTIAKDPLCKSKLSTSQGQRVDKVLVQVGTTYKDAVTTKKGQTNFLGLTRPVSIESVIQSQMFLLPVDLGTMPMAIFRESVDAGLILLKRELLIMLGKWDELPSRSNRNLPGLLDAMGALHVDKRNDTLYTRAGEFSPDRLVGGCLKTLCNLVKELNKLSFERDDYPLPLQISLCLIGSMMELLLFLKTDRDAMAPHWRFFDLMLLSYFVEVSLADKIEDVGVENLE